MNALLYNKSMQFLITNNKQVKMIILKCTHLFHINIYSRIKKANNYFILYIYISVYS